MHFDPVLLSHGDVSAEVVPERGTLVSSLKVGGKAVLSLDRSTLEDLSKNVRGGIPVLFPYAGKLNDGKFLPAGTEMKQHGFGRNKKWTVTSLGVSHVRTQLLPDAETRAVYPYEFSADQTVLILPSGLQIELLIHNLDSKPLPVSPGWHPYFNCAAAQKASVNGSVDAFNLAPHTDAAEFDFGAVAPADGRAHFTIPQLGTLKLSFSPEMRHMQFWSQPGKDFICIEPFTGPNNTVNTDKRIDIPPGAAHLFFMRIEIE